MAKSFLTDIQLNNNVLLNAKIQAWGSAPTGTTNPTGTGTAVAGQISSYLGALYIFNGTAWVAVGGGTVTIGSTAVTVNGSAVTTFAGLSSVTSTAFVGALTGNASTATTLATARTINGTSFDGSANITVTAAAGTLTGSTLASGVTASSLTSVGTLANLTVTNTITGSVSGNAGTATTLATARTINGTSFDGSANITVTAAAGTLTGTTLNSGVTASSLTSVGTLAGLTMGANIAMGNNKITGLATPTADTDAATKLYVDTVSAGINVHEAVKYATTGALGTSGNLVGGTITTTYANGTSGLGATLTIATSSNWTAITIDGQSLTTTDRVLIKDQAAALQNGIYTVTQVGAVGNTTSFIFTRAVDNDQSPEIDAGDLTYVIAGTTNAGDGYVQTTANVVVGTTGVVWTQFSGAGAVPLATTSTAGIASFSSSNFAVNGSGVVTLSAIGSLNTTGSAATLTTSRTLWGQSFNGSANVTGAITGATTITGTAATAFTVQGAEYASTSGQATATYIRGSYATAVSGTAQGGNIYIWAGGSDSGSGTAGSVNIGSGEIITITGTTTISGTVKLPSVQSGSAGFVKIAATTGQLSTASIAYSDLPTSTSTATATAAAATGNVTAARKAIGVGIGTGTAMVVNHGLGQWVTAQLYDTSGNLVEVDVLNASTSGGTTTFTFASSQTLTGFQYVIVG